MTSITDADNMTLKMSGFSRIAPGSIREDFIVLSSSRDGLMHRIVRRDSPSGDARRRAALSLSAGAKTRPQEGGNPGDLLDRLLRGISELKRLADRSLTAMQQDVQRRRAAYFTQASNARRARGG